MSSANEGALGLNDHHEDQIVQYMRFMRYQRGLRIRAIEACFEDTKKSRLMSDTTFTREEVISVLNDLEIVLKGTFTVFVYQISNKLCRYLLILSLQNNCKMFN